VPYDLSPEFVNELFTKHKIDYIIHGDDPCLLPDGTDAYAYAKKLGRFRMVRHDSKAVILKFRYPSHSVGVGADMGRSAW
jgi:glycerol-3-phosphate cytidylyltransferase-like family protein